MKRIFLIIILLVISSTAKADVLTKVYLSDGSLLEPADTGSFPWVYPDIMAGSRLTIYIGSDMAEDFIGLLYVSPEALDYGKLYSKGELDELSILPDAGEAAYIYWSGESLGEGYGLATGINPQAGDWFVLDYNALNTGTGIVNLYGSGNDPIIEMVFNQIPTRDFDDDGVVDFIDYSIFSTNWLSTNCNENNHCSGMDFDADGSVDLTDLKMFADFWLERTR